MEKELRRRGYAPQICEKGDRNKPLTEEQKASNRAKSKVHCRDEALRTIGLGRAMFWIGLRNLAYNMGRLVSLKCPKPVRVR
jgi:IS5 family transposase